MCSDGGWIAGGLVLACSAAPRPTLVSATQPGAAVRAKWPLHDLRNNPRDERAGACPAVEAAAVGSLGSSLPACRAARRGSTPPGPRPQCGQIGPARLRNHRTSAPGACPRAADGSPGGRPCPRRRTARSWSAPPPEAAVRAMWPMHDMRNNPRDERPGACPADEAGGGWIARATRPCPRRRARPDARASATRPEAAVRANWPLRDLRNDSPGERPRACPADEAAAVASPGTRPCRCRARLDAGQRHPPRPQCVQLALARFAQQPSGRAPGGMPSTAACRRGRTRWWAWCRAAAGPGLG